eukprot:2179187-Prymnesium_polylepis.2
MPACVLRGESSELAAIGAPQQQHRRISLMPFRDQLRALETLDQLQRKRQLLLAVVGPQLQRNVRNDVRSWSATVRQERVAAHGRQQRCAQHAGDFSIF